MKTNKHDEMLESMGLTHDGEASNACPDDVARDWYNETMRKHRAEQAEMAAQELSEKHCRIYFGLTNEQLHRKG